MDVLCVLDSFTRDSISGKAVLRRVSKINIKWFGFIIFVWVIGILLASTFEGHLSAEAGVDYSTGTATFTQDSATVTGSETSWTAAMEGGIIELDAHNYAMRIYSVESATSLTLWARYPLATATGAYTISLNPEWSGESQRTTIQYLLNPRNIIYQEGTVGTITWWTAPAEYFAAWFKVIIWDFTFLRGEGYELFRWIVLVPFSVTVIAGIIILFVQLLQGFIHL